MAPTQRPDNGASILPDRRSLSSDSVQKTTNSEVLATKPVITYQRFKFSRDERDSEISIPMQPSARNANRARRNSNPETSDVFVSIDVDQQQRPTQRRERAPRVDDWRYDDPGDFRKVASLNSSISDGALSAKYLQMQKSCKSEQQMKPKSQKQQPQPQPQLQPQPQPQPQPLQSRQQQQQRQKQSSNMASKPRPEFGSGLTDEAEQSRRPYAMWLLLTANIIMFVVTMGAADWKFAPLNENPMIGPSASIFLELGAKDRHSIVDNGEWWRLISAGFLHGGVIHLFLNMWVLAKIGGALEEVFGALSFAAIYMIALVAGNLSSAVFLPEVLGVGASGAIYGIIGAMFADLIQNWNIMPADRWCYLVSMLIETALGLLIGLLPLLDNFSHIGGLLAGFLVGMFLLVLPRWHRDRHAWYWPLYAKSLAIVSLLFLIVWLSVMFSVLYSDVDGNEWCSSCRYLSCVDTPWWTCPQ